MDSIKPQYKYSAIAYKIAGSCMEVHKQLGNVVTRFLKFDYTFDTNETGVFTQNIINTEATTLEDIKTLALQCPYIAGDAVYKARNILAPIETNMRYDDLYICNNQGVYKGGINTYNTENESLFGDETILKNSLVLNIAKVYPNPSEGLLKIDYKIETDGALKLYDISGRLVRTIALPSNTQHIITDIQDLVNGIYTYSISISNQIFNHGKLVKE